MTQQEYEDVHRFLLSKERLHHLAAILPSPAGSETPIPQEALFDSPQLRASALWAEG